MLKALSKPFRHFFNVRFEAINGEIKLVQARIDSLHADLEESSPAAGSAGATSDSLAAVTTVIDARHGDLLAVASLLGRAVDTAVDGVDVLLDRTDPGSDRFIGDALTPIVVKEEGTAEPFDPAVRGTVAALGADDAAIANYSASHLGWASQAGYWFNPPISVAHAEGGVRIGDVNERIAEIPYVFAALSRLPMGSRILDVGSTESTVAVSLASLGYQVTALDPRPYPLEHSNLRVHVGLIEEFSDEAPYDAVVLLSSIEHFGIGAYQLPEADQADRVAMRRIRELLRPGGLLVLTTPFGQAPTTDLERTYRPEDLDQLLMGWDVVERSYLTRASAVEWVRENAVSDLFGNHVVLITAVKPGG